MTIHYEASMSRPNHEQGDDFERLNRESFSIAFDQYLHRYEETKFWQYEQKAQLYCYPESEAEKDRHEVDKASTSIKENYDKLEILGDIETGPAGLTVTIPVAVLSEDIESVKHTIGLIDRAQRNFGQPINVILWANVFYKNRRQKEQVEYDAEKRYALLKEELADYSTNNVRVRTALVTYKGKVHMANVRRDYMEATSKMLAEEGDGFMHPVVWLDADTVSLSKDALTTMKGEIEKGRVLFPHLRSRFEIDWLESGQPLSQADNATKAVAVDEINRRLAYRDHENKGYYEESGFGFAIGTYLASGGLNPKFPNLPMPAISETNTLMTRAIDTMNTRGRLQDLDNPGDFKGWNIIPPSLIQSNEPTTLAGYVEKSTTGSSARRMYKRVRQSGAIALLQYGTELANQLSDQKRARDVNLTDMYLLLNSEQSSRPHVTGHRHRIALKVIQRYFSR